jgi:acylphosphatase
MMNPEEEREAREYTIRGRVQGVGFRWWSRATAEGLGLAGSVRNLPDGSVGLRVAGPVEMLDRFDTLLRRGPSSARVDAVEVKVLSGPDETAREDSGPAENGFHIEHEKRE